MTLVTGALRTGSARPRGLVTKVTTAAARAPYTRSKWPAAMGPRFSHTGNGGTATTSKAIMTDAPQNFLTTRLDALRRWAESGSLWPLPFGTACCAIEFMAVASPRYDIARFGSEVLRFSPRQADVLLVMGTIT